MRRLPAVAAVALAVLAAGCGEPRSGAVSETGPCAQVIPLARARAGKDARLVSVHALKRGQLRPLIEAIDTEVPSARPPRPPRRRAPPARELPRKGCVMIYRGMFAPGGALRGPGPGRYLVLVIRVRHPRLLRALVVERLPRAVSKFA
jgi:hypothetical protein